MRVSVVLDRRCFVMGAVGTAAVVTAAALPRGGWRLALEPSSAPSDWARDHIFGTYPPYAHPIPFSWQSGVGPVQLPTGDFDPQLMT
jgi:hypothetical protein